MSKTDSTTITETRAARLRRLHGEGETGAPPDARSTDGDRGSGEDDAGLDPRLVEELVPDPEVWRELGITSMSGFRWERDAALGFPPKIQVRGRNYRSRRMLEAFKQKLIRKALNAA